MSSTVFDIPLEFCATPKSEKEALPKSYKSQAQRRFNSDSGQAVVSNMKCWEEVQ